MHFAAIMHFPEVHDRREVHDQLTDVGCRGRVLTAREPLLDLTHRSRSSRSSVAIQPIRLFGDPVLRTPAEPVTDFDKELRQLVKDLEETMMDAPGAGLA